MCFNQEYGVLRQDLEMYRWLVIFTLFSIPLNIQAKEMSETTRYAVVGLIGELVECAMFYSIMGAGQDSSGNLSKNSERFLALTEEAANIAYHLSDSVGMKNATITSMAENYSKEMGEEIGFDGINISILINKHGDFCKSLMEDPARRLEYWIQKESE